MALCPVDPEAVRAIAEGAVRDVDGLALIDVLPDDRDPQVDSMAVAGTPDRSSRDAPEAVAEPIGDLDVVILFAADLANVDAGTAAAVADSGRRAGALVACVVVETDRHHNHDLRVPTTPEGAAQDAIGQGRAHLRAAADVLAIVQSPAAMRGFVTAIVGSAGGAAADSPALATG